MEKRVNFVVVGIFVILLTVAAIAGVLWLSSGKYYRKSYDTYLTFMSDSVSGLNVNAPVRYRGVDVGRVRAIALAPGNVELVQVTLDVERGTPVKVDTVALLSSQGLTGIAFVDLTAGSRDAAALASKPGEDYPVIASGRSLLSRLESSVPALVTNLSKVADNFNATLDDDNRRALRAALADLQSLTRTLAARSATIDAALADAARTTQRTARAAEQLPPLLDRIDRSAAAFDRMTEKVGDAGSTATRTIEDWRGDVAVFTGTTLPEVRELVAELRSLTATLQRTADQVERNPNVVLFGTGARKKGPGE